MNIIFLMVFALFLILDLYTNWQDGVPLAHIWHQAALFIFAIAAMVKQIYEILKKNRQIHSLNTELLETTKSYQEWKEKTHTNAVEIRLLIDQQFGVWHLSHSEKDVALLLIKGLSMKEVAEIRKTQEKTVRQQATTIYRKSNLSGRQELAAFFLEDILSSPIEHP